MLDASAGIRRFEGRSEAPFPLAGIDTPMVAPASISVLPGTGRIVVGRGRPESTFDPDLVFGACAHFDKAVEINCRPERLDPPMRLLEQVVASEEVAALAKHAFAIAQAFHAYYQKPQHSLLRAESEELRAFRTLLVDAFLRQMEALAAVLGIPVPERM